MKYKIYISERASQQIKEHLIYISNVSKKAASKQKTVFKESINKIEDNPKGYPFFESKYIPANKYHKYIVSKRYIIIYQIKDDVVYIDYVIDTRQNYSWLIR